MPPCQIGLSQRDMYVKCLSRIVLEILYFGFCRDDTLKNMLIQYTQNRHLLVFGKEFHLG